MTALVRPAFIRHAAAAAAVAAGCALGACASAPARFYTLESTAQPAAATAAAHDLAVIVGPVTVPAGVDRPEMVVQVAPNRVDVDEFNRWATPLGDAIARAVAVDLSVLLATPNVAAAPLANFAADDRVTIDVQRFESIPGDAALLDALWVVRRLEGGATRTGRTVAREPVQGTGYEALAAAHSRAIGRLADDIATAIVALSQAPTSTGVPRGGRHARP
ncbi:MAG TPA: PqiC family protein [Candidatus Binatia bacterium]|nr:PqiC family protein [Candidatus Binatia bacterium]